MSETAEQTFSPGDLERMLPALQAFSRRFYSNPSDQEDLIQETLLKAWSNMDKFTPATALKSWLFTIMRNTFCTRIRLAKREIPSESLLIERHSTSIVDQEWHLYGQQFVEILRDLSTVQQDMVVSIAVNGDTYESVAARYDCPVGTVKSRVCRIREKLVSKMDFDGLL